MQPPQFMVSSRRIARNDHRGIRTYSNAIGRTFVAKRRVEQHRSHIVKVRGFSNGKLLSDQPPQRPL